MSAQAEPSIEDILASIRKIIAEDDEAESARAPEVVEQAAPQAPQEQAPEPVSAIETAPAAATPETTSTNSLSAALMAKAEQAANRPASDQFAEDGDVLNLTQIIDDDGDVRDLSTMSAKEKRALRAVDQAVATEVANAFAAIRGAMDDAQREDPSAALELEGDDALAQAVEDTVRPLVKSWLDANLAPLVERIVREQVAQLAKS